MEKAITMKLDVFGKPVEVICRQGQWRVFYLGNEGKKRAADDIHLPDHLPQSQVLNYLSDLCHEWATPGKPKVLLLK